MNFFCMRPDDISQSWLIRAFSPSAESPLLFSVERRRWKEDEFYCSSQSFLKTPCEGARRRRSRPRDYCYVARFAVSFLIRFWSAPSLYPNYIISVELSQPPRLEWASVWKRGLFSLRAFSSSVFLLHLTFGSGPKRTVRGRHSAMKHLRLFFRDE